MTDIKLVELQLKNQGSIFKIPVKQLKNHKYFNEKACKVLCFIIHNLEKIPARTCYDLL